MGNGKNHKVFPNTEENHKVIIETENLSKAYYNKFIIKEANIGGSVSGLFFNERICKNRKLATVLLILFVLLTIIRGAAEEDAPVIKAVTWLLPPVYSIAGLFGKMKSVVFSGLIFPLSGMLLYLFIISFLYIRLMNSKLFH